MEKLALQTIVFYLQTLVSRIMRKILVSLLLVVAFLFLDKSPAFAVSSSILYFTPQTINVSPNQIFILNSTLNPGNNKIAGVDIYITFNQAVLELNSITPATTSSFTFAVMPLSCNGAIPAAKACINNEVGAASISLAVPIGSLPITAIADVATLSFTAKSPGVSDVDYAEGSNTWENGVGVIQTKMSAKVNILGPTSKIIPSQLSPTNRENGPKLPTIPTGTCGLYNSTTKTTPITFTWGAGIGIQIWDNTGHWWYNGKATSPFTLSSKDNRGIIAAIPTGRIVYARTTFTWHKFSSKNKIICSF